MPGLIQRLADAGRGQRTPPTLLDIQDLTQDIIKNISQLFNCRVDSAPAQMDLGIPPPHELMFDFPESVDRFRDAMIRCINKYEPRLKQVRIQLTEPEEEDLNVHFAVAGVVENDSGDRMVVNFETTVNQSGMVDVRG